jgi:hypothetical protein
MTEAEIRLMVAFTRMGLSKMPKILLTHQKSFATSVGIIYAGASR